ncbi:MAG: DUF2798 domain-containing protein [Parasporobacterium sp.]|nr:DUF2798 domain-containing protein [Parasporobacterium sp.]
MPKTKFQSFIFTLLMVFCMVYAMTCYTIAGKMGGLTYSVFLMAIKEMWIEYVVVFLLVFFIITRAAQKLTFRIFRPGKDNPIFITLSIQCCTVCLIVPPITLFATFFHNGFTADWFTQWISLAFYCFPAALCLQVFFIGPFVRMLFRRIFHRQLKDNAAV